MNDNLFTRLGVMGSIERSIAVLMHQPKIFLLIGIVESIPYMVLFGYLHSMMKTMTGVDPYDPTTTPQNPSKGGFIGVFLLLTLWTPILMIGTGATIRATAEIYAGKVPEIVPCVKEGFRRACRMFLFGILLFVVMFVVMLFVAIFLGLFTAIAGPKHQILSMVISVPVFAFVYFYVAIAFQITPPSIVLEQKTATEAMNRSWELVAGSRCYVFSTILLVVLAGSIVGAISGLLGTLVYVIQFAWYIVALPFGSVLGTVLFLSLRVEKEGLNQPTLLHEMGLDSSGAEDSQDYKPVGTFQEDTPDETEIV